MTTIYVACVSGADGMTRTRGDGYISGQQVDRSTAFRQVTVHRGCVPATECLQGGVTRLACQMRRVDLIGARRSAQQ
jgi:hypothetical protein